MAEFLHENTGWRRNRAMDLRTVLSGTPLPAQVAEAISRERGELDDKPTETILSECLAVDLKANVQPYRLPDRISDLQRQPDLFWATTSECTETQRVTLGELRNHKLASDWAASGADASNAEIAAAVLAMSAGHWPVAKLIVLALDSVKDEEWRGKPGFWCGVEDFDDQASYWRVPTRVRVLAARRFELMETTMGRAWKRMEFKVVRIAAAEWRCEVTYRFE